MLYKALKTASNYISCSLSNRTKELSGINLPFEYFFWEVTNACNSRCLHCHMWQHGPKKDILSLEEIEKIFASGFFNNVKEVIISGGEPVLLPYIKEALLIMHKHISPGALVSFSTNGLLPEKVLSVTKDCLDAGMNIVVGVSLDGVGHHHDKIRGVPGNFDKVDYLLTELLNLKKSEKYKGCFDIGLGYTISPLTEEYFLEVQQYAKNRGLDFIPQVYEDFSYYENNEQKIEEYTPEVFDKVNTMPSCFQKEVILGHLRKNPIQYKCCSMQKFFVLHCNGDIAPCLKYSHVSGGNLKNIDFQSFSRDSHVMAARKIVKSCKGCSNTWATRWNIRYWIFPFLRKLTFSSMKKMFPPKTN